MEKICLYTCITGDYDNLREIDNIEENIDYYCFTNNPNIKSKTWKIIEIEDKTLDNARLSKKIKILGHPIVNDNYQVSVYVDATCMEMKVNKFLKEQCDLSKYSLIGFKHCTKKCVYVEARDCIKFKKDTKELLEQEIEFLKKENYPKNNGMLEAGVLVRKHNDPILKNTMQIWFDMILKYSKRDQVSFPYAAYKTNLNFCLLDLNIYNNPYLKIGKHKNMPIDKFYTVYYDYGEGFTEKNREDFLYSKKKDNLKINIKLKNDVERIRIDYCEEIAVRIQLRDIGNLNSKNIRWIQTYDINNNYISVGDDPQLIIDKKFKKGEKIEIELILKKLNQDEILSYFNKISGINYKLKEENKLSKEKNKTLKKENQTLLLKYNNLNKKYRTIIDSRKYKLFNKIFKVSIEGDE